MGWLCDRIGPRLAYTGLLLIGSLPVMAIGLSHDFTSFLMFRIAIGMIGGSFVITQFHTSMMFAPNCVGTANATAAGWGNLGGGVTQIVMPLIFTGLMGTVGLSSAAAWRTSLFLAGVACALVGIAYYFLTQDTPEGNLIELRSRGVESKKAASRETFLAVCRDPRVWTLFIAYACCFGIELTLDNVAALYFVDYFSEFKTLDTLESMRIAGLVAGLFGGMNIFARTLGGYVGDRVGARWGLGGRVKWLYVVLFLEGIALALFSQTRTLWSGIPLLMTVGLFVKMSNGATYSVVPFINRRALGSVSGIVGAGGNFGAVAAGFLFKSSAISWSASLLILGVIVSCSSFAVLSIKLSDEGAMAIDDNRSLTLPPMELGYAQIGTPQPVGN
jgi:NNP family nitrate/nitrite transporter-like MFS transporter